MTLNNKNDRKVGTRVHFAIDINLQHHLHQHQNVTTPLPQISTFFITNAFLNLQNDVVSHSLIISIPENMATLQSQQQIKNNNNNNKKRRKERPVNNQTTTITTTTTKINNTTVTPTTFAIPTQPNPTKPNQPNQSFSNKHPHKRNLALPSRQNFHKTFNKNNMCPNNTKSNLSTSISSPPDYATEALTAPCPTHNPVTMASKQPWTHSAFVLIYEMKQILQN
jgi:hypothetical protein